MSAAAQSPPPVPNLLDAALNYAGNGLPVFPCNPATKAPLVKDGFKEASADADKVRAWWARWPNAMIGVPTGESSRSWVLDVDDPVAFEAACPFDLPVTRRCETGKGYHLYFEHDPQAPVRNAQRDRKGWPFTDMPGAEVRGEGGYVIVPPSLHPSGRRYAWSSNTKAALPPAGLLRLVRNRPVRASAETPEGDAAARGADQPAEPRGAFHRAVHGADTAYGLAALDSECASIRGAANQEQEGTLNSAGLKIGALVAGGELAIDTARAKLISAGLAMASHDPRNPWTPEAVVKKIERALTDGGRKPRTPPRSDGHTSKRFDPETGAALETGSASQADDGEVVTPFRRRKPIELTDFFAYMPTHNYIFAPSGEFWPSSSVNSRIPPIALTDERGEPLLHSKGQKKGEPIELQANAWLDQFRPVEQMTWAPGEGQVVRDRLISEGGWIARSGNSVFNLYRPPMPPPGDAKQAQPWLDHVRKVYPDDADHLIRWFAHRAQHPDVKINHAIVMGGAQGIGKDTILEPVKAAVGPWNFSEVSPQHMLGRFNGFVRSVILRVSEARDLGDVDRFAFYDHMKTYTAAPPDVLRVDEKHLREYSVFNVCGVIITTNHKTDGIFLPADDRRHYVAWSDCTRERFGSDYWPDIYRWYAGGGIGHVVAYLRELDLSDFDAKAPPTKTPAFWDIVASNQAPEDAELADALDVLAWPDVVTVGRIAAHAPQGFSDWLLDRRNSRRIPHRLEECGYVAVRNRHANDGLFKIGGKRCAVYAKKTLSPRDAIFAAETMMR